MQYMLIYLEKPEDFETRRHPVDAHPYRAAWMSYMQALREAGVMVGGNGLQPPHTATTLSVRDGKRHIEDGPYADAKEQLGGYVVIDVPDLDAALDWAAKSPSATSARVEIRPVMPPMKADDRV